MPSENENSARVKELTAEAPDEPQSHDDVPIRSPYGDGVPQAITKPGAMVYFHENETEGLHVGGITTQTEGPTGPTKHLEASTTLSSLHPNDVDEVQLAIEAVAFEHATDHTPEDSQSDFEMESPDETDWSSAVEDMQPNHRRTCPTKLKLHPSRHHSCQAETPSQTGRADIPLHHVLPYISQIPSATWCRYQSEIDRLHYEGHFEHMPATQRLRTIAKICFRPEEEAAMRTKDWERLRAAVVITGLLAVLTGEMADAEEAGKVDEWVGCRFRDIAMLKAFG